MPVFAAAQDAAAVNLGHKALKAQGVWEHGEGAPAAAAGATK